MKDSMPSTSTLIDALCKKRLVMITGKGGVGKTIATASLGLLAAEQGKKVCLVESSAEDQLGPLLGVGAIGHKLSRYSDHLYLINLEPPKNFRDFVVLHLGFEGMFDRVFSNSIMRSFIRMIPGIAEITLLGRLFHFAELEDQHKFDLIIFDGYASGHFLSLLATPDAILNAGFVGPIVAETTRVKKFIKDPDKTSLLLVGTGEALVLSETLDLIKALEKDFKGQVEGLLINRYLPELPSSSLALKSFEYLYHRSVQCSKNVLSFKEEVKQLNPSWPQHIYSLYERFYIDEPLTVSSAKNLFSKEAWGNL